MHASRRRVRRGHVFPRHAHQGWSVAVVHSGAGYVRARGAPVTAGGGAVTVLHPGEAHRSRVHRDDGLDYTVFDLDEPDVAVLHERSSTPTFASSLVHDADVARGLRAADRLRRTGEVLGADAALAVALQALFARHAGARPVDAAPDSAIRAARDLLDADETGRLTLAELAAAAAVSPATLVRRFVAETGLTPHRYLVSRRVDRAKVLLARGVPVAEAAALAGFADQSHLHRHFTPAVGVTPGRFREDG
jgi:AraC-like DNA-binding protein